MGKVNRKITIKDNILLRNQNKNLKIRCKKLQQQLQTQKEKIFEIFRDIVNEIKETAEDSAIFSLNLALIRLEEALKTKINNSQEVSSEGEKE